MSLIQEIIHLNVGGRRFSTSKETLTRISDCFFSSLVSGRIPPCKDETGAIFIDRDPELFSKILNYLRTKEINLSHGDTDIHALKTEAEYYCITPLVKRLELCSELEKSSCGDVLFQGILHPPTPPATHAAECPAHTASSTQTTYLQTPTLTPRFGSNNSRRRSHLFAHSTENLPTDDQHRVVLIKGHFNWICAAYSNYVALYRLKESLGWILLWTSPYLPKGPVAHVALNAKAAANSTVEHRSRLVAVACADEIKLWCVSSDGSSSSEVGTFNLGTVSVDAVFFIGSQMVALGWSGKVGVWNTRSQNWQVQDVLSIASFDSAGSFLLLGGHNGSIYYIDMQKFPLRMKDNDLLVTELYRDPAGDSITALSIYLTPKTTGQSLNGNWIEIAYGTSAGNVRVIVQHPETVGQGPQLFQTFTVHTNPVVSVTLSEKFLISVCSDYNHVRSWSVTRFRGMINTQPGSVSLASYKVMTLEDSEPAHNCYEGNEIGPFGDKDDVQLFVQKIIPDTRQLYVRLASDGSRLCKVDSVDNSLITCFCVHDCEGSSRMGGRSRKFLFTGHSNGCIQMWDLSTAQEKLDQQRNMAEKQFDGGPSATELVRSLENCDLSNTPTVSPAVSMHTVTVNTENNQAASGQGDQRSS